MKTTFLLLAALLIGCPPAAAPQADTGDAGAGSPEGGTVVTCKAYCDHAAKLGCRQGKPTAHGATCQEFCDNVQKTDYAHVDLKCGYAAASCPVMDACDR